MRVHLFLPENDLALAAGTANYTAPTAARRLHDAGAALPLWYGEGADTVLCYGLNNAWYERMARDFALTTDVFDHEVFPGTEAAPWGWSAYARRYFRQEGFPPDMLPDDAAIEKMRQLSHRSTGARIARLLAERLPEIQFAAPAVEITDAAGLDDIEDEFVIKSPYSSSGRGVWKSSDYRKEVGLYGSLSGITQAGSLPTLSRIAADIIRRQGSVMVEPLHAKVLDFARLYECREGMCRSLGTSVFTTDEHGAYTGNLLASEGRRLEHVAAVYPVELLATVDEALVEIINEEIAPYYTGVLGIDMLVTADGVLDPVVELNLRTTMGYVANRVYDMHIHPDAEGVFAVTPLRDEPAPADDYEVADGRLLRGTLNLVPENPYFAFTCTMENDEKDE